MPILDHAAVFVDDLEATREFYTRYLGATSNDGYHNPRTGLRTYFLSFDGGARVEIMSRPDIEDAPHTGRRGWSHVSLRLSSRDEVDALAERCRTDGVPVTNGPRVTGDGYYEAVILDPEGNEIELVA